MVNVDCGDKSCHLTSRDAVICDKIKNVDCSAETLENEITNCNHDFKQKNTRITELKSNNENVKADNATCHQQLGDFTLECEQKLNSSNLNYEVLNESYTDLSSTLASCKANLTSTNISECSIATAGFGLLWMVLLAVLCCFCGGGGGFYTARRKYMKAEQNEQPKRNFFKKSKIKEENTPQNQNGALTTGAFFLPASPQVSGVQVNGKITR